MHILTCTDCNESDSEGEIQTLDQTENCTPETPRVCQGSLNRRFCTTPCPDCIVQMASRWKPRQVASDNVVGRGEASVAVSRGRTDSPRSNSISLQVASVSHHSNSPSSVAAVGRTCAYPAPVFVRAQASTLSPCSPTPAPVCTIAASISLSHRSQFLQPPPLPSLLPLRNPCQIASSNLTQKPLSAMLQTTASPAEPSSNLSNLHSAPLASIPHQSESPSSCHQTQVLFPARFSTLVDKSVADQRQAIAATSIRGKLEYLQKVKEPAKVAFMENIPSSSTRDTEAVLRQLLKSILDTFEFTPVKRGTLQELVYPAADQNCALVRFFSEALVGIIVDYCSFEGRSGLTIDGTELIIRRTGEDAPALSFQSLKAQARGRALIPGNMVYVSGVLEKWYADLEALRGLFTNILEMQNEDSVNMGMISSIFVLPKHRGVWLQLASIAMADLLFYRSSRYPSLLEPLGSSVVLCRHSQVIPLLAVSQKEIALLWGGKEYQRQRILLLQFQTEYVASLASEKVKNLFEYTLRKIKRCGLKEAALESIVPVTGTRNVEVTMTSENAANAVMDYFIAEPKRFVLEGGPPFLVCRHPQYIRPGAIYKLQQQVGAAHKQAKEGVALCVRGVEKIQCAYALCSALNEVFERAIAGCGVLEMGTQVILDLSIRNMQEMVVVRLVDVKSTTCLLAVKEPLQLSGRTIILSPMEPSLSPSTSYLPQQASAIWGPCTGYMELGGTVPPFHAPLHGSAHPPRWSDFSHFPSSPHIPAYPYSHGRPSIHLPPFPPGYCGGYFPALGHGWRWHYQVHIKVCKYFICFLLVSCFEIHTHVF